MIKHSPGPWIAKPLRSPEEYGVFAREGTQLIAQLYVDLDEDSECHEKDIANAHFIAAAPELLELIKEILHEVDGFEKRTGVQQFVPWVRKAKHLVARIEK